MLSDTLTPETVVDDSVLYNELLRRVEDAQQERAQHEQQWRDNDKLVLGDHGSIFDTGKHHYFIANRARQIVDAHTAIMTEQMPRNVYAPRETGEPPDWIIRPESVQKLSAVAQMGIQLPLTPAQMQGIEYIDNETAMKILSITVPQEVQVMQEQPPGEDGEGGEPQPTTMVQQVPVFSPDDFYIIDAQLEAELLTQEVDNQATTMAHWESRITENIFGTQVVGHKDIMVQWDADNHHFTLQNLYPYNTWIDPWATDTSNAEYYIIREFLPISEAKAEYPELEAFIDSKATMGGISSVASGVTGGKFQRSGMRQSIERWTWWQRNHPVDMSEDEALATGRVQPAIEEVQEDAVDPETGEPIIDPETGDAVQQTVQVHATTEDGRRMYVLTETGQMVMPGDPEWPKRKVLRQIQFLADKVVFDDVSPFVDIPVGRNKCMMIDESPYAQGEPQRIAGLIDLRNRLFSIWYGYAKRFRSPEQIIPADVFNATRKAVEELHSDASKKWIIPSELWMQYGGDVIRNLEAPQLGPVISHMMDVVDREIDKISGMTEVIRGETKSDQSGELFRAALEAARGPIGLKARNTARALKHIGHVIAYLIIDLLPSEVWAQRNRKYPVQVFERVKERLRVNGVNVHPQVTGAETRDKKISDYQGLVQMGIMTPTLVEQLMDQVGVSESRKIVSEWQQQQMAAAMPSNGTP